jgi:hypothetical protein
MSHQKNTHHIPREIINLFLKQKKIPDIVSFLVYIEKEKNFKAFALFCGEHGYDISYVKKSTPLVFHGAPDLFEVLTPQNIDDGVYATDDPNYALFLAILYLKIL